MDIIPTKSVVLISSGQPALNPRMVKEADALAEAGYRVTVLYAHWNKWGTDFDNELIPSKKWGAICIGGDPEQKKLTYFFSRLIHKLAKAINKLSGGKFLAELAITRPAYYLMRDAKKHQADLYIAHNLGALPAAVKAAEKNKKAIGFDAEDFHRFETSNSKTNPDVVLKSQLEDRYIPFVHYLTASSPLIAEAYRQLFPFQNPTVILNVFNREITIKQPVINIDQPIKLFWFSQTIGVNRGLEDVITAMQLLKGYPFELNILGFLTSKVKTDFIDKLLYTAPINIRFHDPVAPDSLTEFASQFHIGLALEPAFSTNNNLALSNKIFTYLQAGLAVIASDTSAQERLLNEYPGIGKIYQKTNIKSLAAILLYYHQNRKQLLETQKAALQLAHEKLNWETEKEIFLLEVKKTLDRN